jgi:hypothetical protein
VEQGGIAEVFIVTAQSRTPAISKKFVSASSARSR